MPLISTSSSAFKSLKTVNPRNPVLKLLLNYNEFVALHTTVSEEIRMTVPVTKIYGKNQINLTFSEKNNTTTTEKV